METMKMTQDSVLARKDEPDMFSRTAEARGEVPSEIDLHLWQVLARTASTYPDREAVVSTWQSSLHADDREEDGTCLRWTYQELLDMSRSVAESLRECGCRPGMRLAAVLWNSADWALFFWAATRMGMVFAPVDPQGVGEARRILQFLKPDVVVVHDEDGVSTMDGQAEESWTEACIRIQCAGGVPTEGWLPLHDILYRKASPEDLDSQQPHDPSSTALIIFTSGTTTTPKACPHTSRNLLSQTNNYDPNTDASFIDRWLIHTPVSHIFALNNALRGWRQGDAVVFPSKTFDVGATLEALTGEKCTVMAATPTLAKTLVGHPSFPGVEGMALSLVSMAATIIRREDIQLCRERLGTKDAIQSYGMSEGAPIIGWQRTDEMLKDGYHPGVGKVLPGAAIRVCHPNTRQVLERDQVGELHVSGPSVIAGYLDNVGAESFYDDASGRWLVTGDQGMMDAEGVVHIFGRYKDIIIRGGENLNPAQLEEALTELPGVQAFVIGVPDEVAGELPVAVVKLDTTVSKAQLKKKALALGPKYALEDVYTLDDLGLDAVPTTSLGKVKKQELRDIVQTFRHLKNNSTAQEATPPIKDVDPQDPIVEDLLTVWEDMTGTRPSATESITLIADSILLLRYCDAVFRSCGQRMYLQDVVEHDTVEKQATLLRARRHHKSGQGARSLDVSGHKDKNPDFPMAPKNRAAMGEHHLNTTSSEGRPAAVNKHENKTEMLCRYAEKELQLLGLGQPVIEDIIPIRESLHRTVLGQRPQSYHVRMVFRVHQASVQQIIRGTEKALSHHPILQAVLVRGSSGNLEHLILKSDHRLLDNLVSTCRVQSEEEAKHRWEDDSLKSHPSSFMFRAEIISVEATGGKYLCMQYNHSVIDALSLWPWHQDLDRLIDDVNAGVSEQTPFKRFAELFNLYEDSTLARRATLFHVKRLRGISLLKQALWPPQRAPGWMISNDEGSDFTNERRHIRNQVWDGLWVENSSAFRYPRLGRVVRLPGLQKLRESFGIEASLFAKCAVYLFNVLKTGSSHAIVNTWEAGRSWPFVPSWIEETLPPAMSIGGPTAQWILNLVQVFDDETVLEYLARMIGDAEDVQRHQHAPWQKIVDELRDEGPVAVDASFRQSFVWDVSIGLATSSGFRGDLKTLEPVARMDWADCGFFWNAFMVDKESLYFIASWDTAQMNDVEVGECSDLLAYVMLKLACEDNWHLTIGSIFGRRNVSSG